MKPDSASTRVPPPDGGEGDLERRVDALVDEYRARCLWFLRPDYYPANVAERIRVLQYIERYGDMSAHRRAAELRKWLSHSSSATPAGS